MSHSQFHSIKSFILRHAWLNLWDKHMTTGRINQVTTKSEVCLAPSSWANESWAHHSFSKKRLSVIAAAYHTNIISCRVNLSRHSTQRQTPAASKLAQSAFAMLNFGYKSCPSFCNPRRNAAKVSVKSFAALRLRCKSRASGHTVKGPKHTADLRGCLVVNLLREHQYMYIVLFLTRRNDCRILHQSGASALHSRTDK